MGRHQVRHDVLFLAALCVDTFKFFDKCIVDFIFRLAHPAEHIFADVLGGNPQLSADMVGTELLQECFVRICHQVIKPESGAYEDFFYSRKVPQFSQKLQIIGVVHFQVGTWLGEEAFPVAAGPAPELGAAGGLAEFCCRAAHIIDIAFESGFMKELLRFLEDRCMASCLDDPSLVEGERAEVAVSETSAVAGQAEADISESRDTSLRVVGRVPGAHVGKCVDIVHLHLRQRQ